MKIIDEVLGEYKNLGSNYRTLLNQYTIDLQGLQSKFGIHVNELLKDKAYLHVKDKILTAKDLFARGVIPPAPFIPRNDTFRSRRA